MQIARYFIGLDNEILPSLPKHVFGRIVSRALRTLITLLGVLIFTNILAVILESMPSVEKAIPHSLWQLFETLSSGLYRSTFST